MGKLGIFLLANYPSKERFIEAVRACATGGIDFLEIGFPFSDPVADGDILERAACETLEEYDFEDSIESLKDARRIFKGRVYVMTYTNVVYGIGVDAFAEKVGRIQGIILADMPCREAGMFDKGFKKHGIGVVRFLTPESRDEDMEAAVMVGTDFIYFVSKRGTTGGGFALHEETIAKIRRVRGRGVDVYIGFGIKEKKDVDLAWSAADGAIIGTKAVEELEKGIEAFSEYVRKVKG
jgi:tryptophan synthase alpha chain